jgi:hypothetical protein
MRDYCIKNYLENSQTQKANFSERLPATSATETHNDI